MKTLQRTLTIVTPDAVAKNAVGDIIEQFEKNGFHILAMKMLEISKYPAEQFYAVHASRPFYNSLTDFMSSGPIVTLALEKENAIADLRKLMGATNPATRGRHIRKKWASSIEHNAIHGSDAEDTARFELSFFFAGMSWRNNSAASARERAESPPLPERFVQVAFHAVCYLGQILAGILQKMRGGAVGFDARHLYTARR